MFFESIKGNSSSSIKDKSNDDKVSHLKDTPRLHIQRDNSDDIASSIPKSLVADFPDVYVFEPKLFVPVDKKVDEQLLLSNEYNKSDSIQQISSILQECGSAHVHILSITLQNHADIIRDLVIKWMRQGENLCIFNLCDGTETDGYPGLSIVSALQRSNLPYTGADVSFYDGTTSKPYLKRKLIEKSVPTSLFIEIRKGCEEEDIIKAELLVGYPMIVKPSVSYASLSISDKSVVKTREEAIEQAKKVHSTTLEGVFVEQFLPGREFTGDSDIGVHVYMAAERVFNSKLGTYQRLLAFDRYWQGYDLQGNKPDEHTEQLYWYAPAPSEWQEKLKELAKNAYNACGGSGYGRVDIRTKSLDSPDAYVLEVNANCGLSFGKGSSSLGEILEMSHVSPSDFCKELVHYAIERQKRRGSQGQTKMMGAKPRTLIPPL